MYKISSDMYVSMKSKNNIDDANVFVKPYYPRKRIFYKYKYF